MQTIRNDYLSIRVDEKGAEMRSIKDKDNNEYLWQGNSQYWEGQAPNLFPYVGRLTKGKYSVKGQTYAMDIHGFAKDMDFEIVQKTHEQVVFCLKDNSKTQNQYPYAFRFYVRYKLEGYKLSILYQVYNDNEEKMYFGFGGHSGFCVPMEKGLVFEDYLLEFDTITPTQRVGFSEDCFLNGEDSDFS